MTFVEELVPHLPEWLGRQRWFGAKGREVSAVEVVSATSLTDTEPLLDLLDESASGRLAPIGLQAQRTGQRRPLPRREVVLARWRHDRDGAELHHGGLAQFSHHAASWSCSA